MMFLLFAFPQDAAGAEGEASCHEDDESGNEVVGGVVVGGAEVTALVEVVVDGDVDRCGEGDEGGDEESPGAGVAGGEGGLTMPVARPTMKKNTPPNSRGMLPMVVKG